MCVYGRVSEAVIEAVFVVFLASVVRWSRREREERERSDGKLSPGGGVAVRPHGAWCSRNGYLVPATLMGMGVGVGTSREHMGFKGPNAYDTKSSIVNRWVGVDGVINKSSTGGGSVWYFSLIEYIIYLREMAFSFSIGSNVESARV